MRCHHHRYTFLLFFVVVVVVIGAGGGVAAHQFDYECKCVRFNVTSGRFQSPEFPAPLDSIRCMFYHFQAPKDHIIRLTFDVFHLPPRIGVCSSSVMLYDHTFDGRIEIGERADFEFCGKEIAVGRNFYSKDEHMLLQIRHDRDTSRGFSGTFQAIPKRNFSSDAVEMAECSFRVEKSTAILYSPQYPYYYPSNVNCTYVIPQRKGFQIVLNSIVIELGHNSSLQIFENIEGVRLVDTDIGKNIPNFRSLRRE